MSGTATTIVLIGFLVVMGVVVPICGVFEKIREVISLRWLVIVTILALTLGAVIDFDHLDDASRLGIIIGGMVIGGLFVLLRTYEKCKAKGWAFPSIPPIVLKKGDISAEIGNARESDDR